MYIENAVEWSQVKLASFFFKPFWKLIPFEYLKCSLQQTSWQARRYRRLEDWPPLSSQCVRTHLQANGGRRVETYIFIIHKIMAACRLANISFKVMTLRSLRISTNVAQEWAKVCESSIICVVWLTKCVCGTAFGRFQSLNECFSGETFRLVFFW